MTSRNDVKDVAIDKAIQVLKQILACEEHALDIASSLQGDEKIGFIEFADALRGLRQSITSKTLKMSEIAWCMVKHLLLAEVHCQEALERFARLHAKGEDVKEYIDLFSEIFSLIKSWRRQVYEENSRHVSPEEKV